MRKEENMEFSEAELMEKAVEAVKVLIINLESSDFVSNVGWRSSEELRLYAADMAYDIYLTFIGADLEYYNASEQIYFVEAFKGF